MKNTKQLLVALVFSLAAAAAAGGIYQQRDVLFAWDWARPHGHLELTVAKGLEASAQEEAEKAEPGKRCVAIGLAHDSQYAYFALGCAAHAEDPERAAGDPAPRAARFRYWGEHVYGLEQAGRVAYENSVRRLFPREVYVRLKLVASSDYLAALVARARSR